MVTRRPGGPDGPDNVDAAFAEIVADLEREGIGSLSSEEPARFDRDRFPLPHEDPAGSNTPTSPTGWRVANAEWDWAAASDEDHYVPPEPPPLPRLRPGTVLGVVILMIGILLLVVPPFAGMDSRITTPVALVVVTAGIGWLVLRMRQGPPTDMDRDDGAQL